MPRPTVMLAHANAEQFLAGLQEHHPDYDFVPVTNAAALADAAAKHKIEIAFSCVSAAFPRGDHRPILAIPSLRWLQVGGSGFDHVAGWQTKSFTLTNAAGVLAPYLAETILTMIQFFCLRLPQKLAAQKTKTWQPVMMQSVAGKRLLIVGTGAIAQAVAVRASMLGMRVAGITRSVRNIEGFDQILPREDLHRAISQADFVSLHVAADTSTHKLFGARCFAAMQPHAYFLNAARGAVVDEAALIDCLRRQTIAGAYLDVFEQEPLPAKSPLWSLDNVVISAHCADMVEQWEADLVRFFSANLERWRAGGHLSNVIPRQ